MKNFIIYSLLALAALTGWSSCSDDEEVVSKNNVEVQINLAVPANDLATRALGDPGVYESFPPPTYVYVFAIINGNKVAYRVSPSDLSVNWQRSGDFYETTAKFNLEFNENITSAKAYIIASAQPISFLGSLLNKEQASWTPDDVVNAIINAQKDNNNADLNLRDVYSTPYNLLNTDNEYYGTGTVFLPGQNGNETDKTVIAFGTTKNKLTLYRVAAKVDFQWEAQDHTSNSTIKKIEVKNAPTQGYCFKPVANKEGTSYSRVYTATVLSENEVNEGNKWEGRAYTYMLQPQNYSLTYKVTTEQGSKTVTTSETGMSKSEIYSAWYMIRLNLK